MPTPTAIIMIVSVRIMVFLLRWIVRPATGRTNRLLRFREGRDLDEEGVLGRIGLGWVGVEDPHCGPRPRGTSIPENGDAGGWLRDSGRGRTEQRTEVLRGNRVARQAMIAATCRNGIAVKVWSKLGRLRGLTGPRRLRRQRNQAEEEHQYRRGEPVVLHVPIIRDIAINSNKEMPGLFGRDESADFPGEAKTTNPRSPRMPRVPEQFYPLS
jgi:hypothetical protein